MKVFRGLEEVTLAGPTAVTLGAFDGVHVGHAAVMARLRERAAAAGLTAVALTFDPHPDHVLRSEHPLPLLTTTEEKLELLAALGLDAAVVMRFDPESAAVEPEDFLREALRDRLSARLVVVGPRTTFGHRGRGTPQLLAREGPGLGIAVEMVGPVLVGDREVSSTAIRELIGRGQVEEAAALLGRRYAIAGEVRFGRGVGRHLGFPTANVAPPEHKAVPGEGVYAAVGVWAGGRSAAAVSIGSRPTFSAVVATATMAKSAVQGEGADAEPPGVETYLLTSRQPPGYGDRLTVEFVRRLREQRRFRDPGELSEQIARDCEEVRRIAGG